MTQPIYAVGDIHGQIDQLLIALDRIERDGGPDAPIVFLGDYVDRGPHSAAVIELLRKGLADGKPWTALKGNHDRLFEWFLEETPRHDPHLKVGHYWLHPDLGGQTTLASYGVAVPEGIRLEAVHAEALKAVPQAHREFLRALTRWHQTDDHIFVHAGLRPDVPLTAQNEQDLVWIREPFLSDTRDFGKLIVHGHTARDYPEHCGNRVNLDGGAAYGRPLYPAVLQGRDVWLLTEDGRVPLSPQGENV
ncbi:metallophosphoesterase [Cognatishimia sp. SS12]|uniref:metallophosphoesterase n=1 Tax=Cognatishimia sp. SS12 TaxID=2979465 RepID=UPI00232CD766|nr:metallophosphoesterase [Cognatishimia sp. SS12]MDC0737882.1 metallophosphoesterase [Cognatishimia sp. SS12]